MLRYGILLATLLLIQFSDLGGVAQGKKFMRCELSRELLQKYQFSKTFLSNWICMIEHESFLDTRTVTSKPNGSANFGLFQINSKDWCRVDRKGGYCNKKCEDFINDNIADDVECAKLIFEREGFKYWQGWNASCRNSQNLPNLSVACNIRNINSLSPYRWFMRY